MRSVAIIGVGRVGGALAIALSNAGYRIECLVSNSPAQAKKIAETLPGESIILEPSEIETIKSDIVFITTQDSRIKATAESISTRTLVPGTFVFHMSGALLSVELESLAFNGCRTASVHPLVSVSDPFSGGERFRGAYFAIEGDAEAVDEALVLAGKLGGIGFEIDSEAKTLYHAAAVVASGHLIALIETAGKMLSMCGLEEDVSKKALLPLIRSTVANVSERSSAEALTGPFARADVETIRQHLAKLTQMGDTKIEDVYRLLGSICVEIAARTEADPANLDEIRNLILLDKSTPK
jgi:predicted short-subunit dehydrogenase-like oxidoreductase (DUF2520 family)